MRKHFWLASIALAVGCSSNPIAATPEGKQIDELVIREFGGQPYAVVHWWPPRQDDGLWGRVRFRLKAELDTAKSEYDNCDQAGSPELDVEGVVSKQMTAEEKLAALEELQIRVKAVDPEKVATLQAKYERAKRDFAEWEALNPLRFCRLRFSCTDKTGAAQEHDEIFVMTQGVWKVAREIKQALLADAEWK
jgi:hypothetical protein